MWILANRQWPASINCSIFPAWKRPGRPDLRQAVEGAVGGWTITLHRSPHGRHVQLGCPEPDAVDLVSACVDELVSAIEPFADVFVYVSKAGISWHLKWT